MDSRLHHRAREEARNGEPTDAADDGRDVAIGAAEPDTLDEVSHGSETARAATESRARNTADRSAPGGIASYFRQMGRAEPISREQEVALAQRIEAAQDAVLAGLCGVPLLIGQIDGWGEELREERLRLRDLVDLAAPEDASAVHSEIRRALGEFVGKAANEVPSLYGGSVNSGNAAALMGADGVDGLLVGGASLDVDGWARVCET